jgi:hypothetical protein
MTLRLKPLTAAVGRDPHHQGDWTYRLCTPTTWVL